MLLVHADELYSRIAHTEHDQFNLRLSGDLQDEFSRHAKLNVVLRRNSCFQCPVFSP